MKKHKLGIILGTLFFAFIVFLMWETLSTYWKFLPIALIGASVVLIAFLIWAADASSSGKVPNKTGSHEVYAAKYFAQAASTTFVTIAITVMLAVLLNKNSFSKNFDLTTNHINSLSKESTQFLNSLDTNVQIICIPGQSLTDNYCDSTTDIIKLYEKTNNHIINLGTLDLRDSSLLSRVQPSGFSRLVLMSPTNKSEITGNITESKLTNSIVNLIKFKKTVYFLAGHGEPELTASNSTSSYTEVVTLLETKAYSVQAINTRDSGIPKDARVLVAGDNLIPYDASTETELINFVERGGRLILIANPYREQGLQHLYARLNLKPDNVLLTLNRNSALGKQLAKQNLLRPPVVMSEFNTDSPITNIVAQAYGAQASIPIDGARPFTILDSTKTNVKTSTTVLMSAVQAAPITLTEAERNKINLQRPLVLNPDKKFDADVSWPIGFDIEVGDNKSEVIVYGFSLVNQYSSQVRVTEELIPLTVAQLYEDKELISIPARDFAPKPFNFSLNPGAWVLLFAGFLPVCTAIAGIFFWARRRTA